MIRTTPFDGTTTSMRDGEGSAYVPRDDSLWLADDNANRAYEVDRATGALRRMIGSAEFQGASPYGGGPLAGPDRAGDLKGVRTMGIDRGSSSTGPHAFAQVVRVISSRDVDAGRRRMTSSAVTPTVDGGGPAGHV
jgi:hypothetical protein